MELNALNSVMWLLKLAFISSECVSWLQFTFHSEMCYSVNYILQSLIKTVLPFSKSKVIFLLIM